MIKLKVDDDPMTNLRNSRCQHFDAPIHSELVMDDESWYRASFASEDRNDKNIESSAAVARCL
jgi:hypothetical protein